MLLEIALALLGGGAPAPERVSFPTADGGVVHADVYGAGEHAVVLAHGGRFDKGSWEAQARALAAAGLKVLAIDFRGYGLSRGPGQADPLSAPLHLDVLAAVGHARGTGAKRVSLVGGSMGGAAAADAAAEAGTGEIEALVLVGSRGGRRPERLGGRKLFITARDDLGPGDRPRLPGIRADFDRAPEPKELVLLEGAAHAQALFATPQGERLTKEILRFLSASPAGGGPDTPRGESGDVAAARAVFERNLDAIARRDRDAYLATYLDAPTLARTGPDGPVLGFEPFAKGAGSQWPDTFEARDMRLVPVGPGVVYGTYRYRVRYGPREHSGLSERVLVATPQGWRIAVTSAFDAPPGTAAAAHALAGATLIDGRGGPPVADAVVMVREGRIECAGRRAECAVPAGTAVTDVSGHWITPGLVDAHVHFSQTGWADGRPDALDVREEWPYEKTQAELEGRPERFFRSYLCSGVTAVFDVGGYPWTTRLWRRAEADPRAPYVAAAGPLLSTVDHWLNLPAERQFMVLSDEHAAREGVRYLAALGARAVKVWYIVTPQRTVESSAAAVMAAGDEARKAGLPLIVHATGLAEAKVALRAGARLLVHGVGDPVDDEFLSMARAAGTVYCPTLTVLDGYVRMNAAVLARQAPEQDDPNGCVDAATRARLEATARIDPQKVDAARADARRQRALRTADVGRANLKRVHGAGIPVAMGTDAGNPLTLHGPSVYAEMEAMQASGLTALQVLAASTAGGARALGRDAEIGTIEKGKAADLLVVAADPSADIANLRRLRFVMRAGVLRSVEELSAAASQ